MAKFTVSDVMERKVDGISTGYIVVIECEGSAGVKVSSSVFVTKKELPTVSASGIASVAEAWLVQKEGAVTRAETMAGQAVSISDEQVKKLIPSAELNIGVVK